MKWEYCFTKFSENRDWATNELNKLGNDGWEAVTIMPDGHLLMKRPKSQVNLQNEALPPAATH
jgi:hypothetical protein